jgi:SSS family transporter
LVHPTALSLPSVTALSLPPVTALSLPLELATRLSTLDLALVALYLVAITLFGLTFAKRGKKSASLKTYFLADNTIPWWAIALSIVSAETSTLTIISVPGVAFAGNFGFLQLVLGYMVGRVVVAILFLPRYFRGEMLTAYQLIDRRFGPVLHKVTAGLFLLTRAAAEGVRVFAISIVVSIAIDIGDVKAIALITTLTLLYTFEGGLAAVIWTDVAQMALYIVGTIAAILTLGHQIPGGWQHIVAVAQPLGKFHMLDFAFNLTQTYTFWAGLLGGTFLTMASHGTDQLMVQRMLAARNLTGARLALLSSGVVIFFQFTLFLLIGAGLFVFYGLHPQTFSGSDRIFPTFIVQQMPHGIAGLLVAAILAAAMSNLSAALNSLSSTTVIDFYVPFRTWKLQKKHVILREAKNPCILPESARPLATNTDRVSRLSTLVWAVVLFAIAVYSIRAGGKGHVV